MNTIFKKYDKDYELSEELKEELYINITDYTIRSFHYSKDWVNDIYIECLRCKDFSIENIKKESKKAESRKISQNRKERGLKRITVTDEQGNKSRQWRKVIPSTLTIETFEKNGINIDCITEFSTPHPYLSNNEPFDECESEHDNYYNQIPTIEK